MMRCPIPSPRALEILAAHGARVDWKAEIVRIPPDLVRRAMSTALRSFVLGRQEERLGLLTLAELERILAAAEREAERIG